MNWFKYSQALVNSSDPQTTNNIGTPNVNIRPYEPVIVEAVNEIKAENPGVLNNISDINVDIGHGQFGSVSNQSPNSININLNKIKSQISTELGTSFNQSDPKHLQMLKYHIKEILAHEHGHLSDLDPNTGQFPGGELVAENAQKKWVDSHPLKFD